MIRKTSKIVNNRRESNISNKFNAAKQMVESKASVLPIPSVPMSLIGNVVTSNFLKIPGMDALRKLVSK